MAKVSKREWNHNGEARTAYVVRYKQGGAHRSRQFARQKDADAFRRRIERELDDGTAMSPDARVTVAQAATHYLKMLEDGAREGVCVRGRRAAAHRRGTGGERDPGEGPAGMGADRRAPQRVAGLRELCPRPRRDARLGPLARDAVARPGRRARHPAGITGHGARYDVAGLVHRGEVVFSQDDVARHGGVAAVEVMRRGGGLRGYDGGGIVGRDAFTMPSAAAMQPANGNALPPINFIGQRPAGSPEMEPAVKRRSDGGIDVIVRTMEGRMGQRAAAGQGPFKQAAGGAGYRIG